MNFPKSLSEPEIKIIKGMLALYPRINDQEILAYFTRPWRSINHRVIAKIREGNIFKDIKPASRSNTIAFMYRAYNIPRVDASIFMRGEETNHQEKKQTNDLGLHLFLNWWPVGQGLFATGSLRSNQGTVFTWAYDCGTTSPRSVLKKAIESYETQQDRMQYRSIDLAVLSHFDTDHINGFASLVKSQNINVVLLPYIPLWQRIIIAIEQRVAIGSRLFDFFISPSDYLMNIEDGSINSIVFVQSTGPDELPSTDPDDLDGSPPSPEKGFLKFDQDPPPPESAEDPVFHGKYSQKVGLLRKAGRIVSPGFWEFLPYNDAEMLPLADKNFVQSANALALSLRNSPNRARTLAQIKKLYISTFGGSSKARNLISLFVYSGPIGMVSRMGNFATTHRTGLELDATRFSQMYTGDGYLDTDVRYNAFEAFFAPSNRLKRSAIFQVMHHGSEKNWHQNCAEKISPSVSIFSSDPSHRGYGHPDADVLRDFWPFFCVQVDKNNGFELFAKLLSER